MQTKDYSLCKNNTYRGSGMGLGTRMEGKDKHPASAELRTDGDNSVQ